GCRGPRLPVGSSEIVARGNGVGMVAAQGLDSTSLCFLALRAGAKLSAVTYEGRDPGNDDATWARRAALELGSAGNFTHRVMGQDKLPLPYQGLWEPGDPMDEPFAGLRDIARIVSGIY